MYVGGCEDPDAGEIHKKFIYFRESKSQRHRDQTFGGNIHGPARSKTKTRPCVDKCLKMQANNQDRGSKTNQNQTEGQTTKIKQEVRLTETKPQLLNKTQILTQHAADQFQTSSI